MALEQSTEAEPENQTALDSAVLANLITEGLNSQEVIRWYNLRAHLGRAATRLAETGPGQIVQAVGNDLKDSDNKLITYGTGVLAAGTQAIGGAKLPLLFGPAATMSFLEATHSAPATGAIIGSAYFAWTGLVAKTIDKTTEEYPDTFATIGESYPGFVNVTKSLPGLNPDQDQSDKNLVKTAVTSVAGRIGRGVTAVYLSTAGYVLAAGVQGLPRKAMNKLCLNLSADAGLVAGAICGSAAEAVTKLAASDPAAAHAIESGMQNHYLGAAAGLGVVALTMTVDRVKSIRRAPEASSESLELLAAQEDLLLVPPIALAEA